MKLLDLLRLDVSPHDAPEGKIALAAGRVTKIECARSGQFTAMGGKVVKFTPDGLMAIAESFSEPKKLKISHDPITTATPNCGQVVGLKYDEKRDRLIASIKPTEHLAAQNRNGAFDRVSMELLPGSGGGYALDALSFLGAFDPAITELEPVALADGGEGRVILCCADESGEAEETVALADFTQAERDALSKTGAAMPDGSYPIRNKADLSNAIQAFGRAKNPDAVKAHIKKRAAALGATDMLPESWGTQKKVAAAAAEEEQVEKEKLELAEAENKALKVRLAEFAEADAKAFLASSEMTKRLPMKALKPGSNFERIMTVLSAQSLSGDATKIKLAAADGKSESEMSLFEGLKAEFASWPEKLTKEEQAESGKRGADDGEKELPPNVARYDFAANNKNNDLKFGKSEFHDRVLAYMAAEEKAGRKITYTLASEVVSRADTRKSG